MPSHKKSVSLVLGSGGARGLAHIGVIRWLEEHNYEIRSISGCSIGALIGGIYAIGELDEFEQWVRAVTRRDILALLDPALDRRGLIKGDKIINTLKDLVGDAMIESLPINFTAVATNINTGKEVWIRKGPIFDAIRASISLPLLFTAFNYKGQTLIDGGVVNPVPKGPTFGDETDITIAVNLCASSSNGSALSENSTAKREAAPSPLRDTINRFIASVSPTLGSRDEKELDMYDIAYQSFDAMQGSIARQKLAAYPPDIVVEIARSSSRTLEFNRANELIALGYSKMGEKLQ
jgi:NTE family protein